MVIICAVGQKENKKKAGQKAGQVIVKGISQFYCILFQGFLHCQ